MKSLFAITSLLVAFSAQAGEFSQPDSVFFQTAATWVPATKVCRDGNFLKHKDKEFVAVQNCQGSSESNCETVHRELLQPVVGVARRCVEQTGREKSNCRVWKSFPLDQSTVRVTKYSSRNAAEDQRGGTVAGRYTIPACK